MQRGRGAVQRHSLGTALEGAPGGTVGVRRRSTPEAESFLSMFTQMMAKVKDLNDHSPRV